MPTDPKGHFKCMQMFYYLHQHVLCGQEFFEDPNKPIELWGAAGIMERAWDGIGKWLAQIAKPISFCFTTKMVSLCIFKYIDENMTSKFTWPISNDFSLSIQWIEIGKWGRFFTQT